MTLLIVFFCVGACGSLARRLRRKHTADYMSVISVFGQILKSGETDPAFA